MFDLVLSRDANQSYQDAPVALARKLNRCFEKLRIDPFRHPMIAPLSGRYRGHYRYRVGDYRVLYRVDAAAASVEIVLIAHRRESYR